MSVKRGPRRGRIIPALVACFYAGGVAGWLLHATFSTKSSAPRPVVSAPAVRPESRPRDVPAATSGERRLEPRPAGEAPEVPIVGRDPIAELRRHRLRLPIEGADVDAMEGGFGERRGGGRRHEAVDVLAPRHTPVHAVEGGRIARLFFSEAGGTTIYQFDPTERYCYYYAHLQRYAADLREGQEVSAGDVVGYVGTSGNAPAGTPHLHFGIFELTGARRWWEGRPLDPYLVYRR